MYSRWLVRHLFRISENSAFSVCLVLCKRRLTYLETTHVVDLGAQGQRGQYMDRREDDPEPDVIFSEHLGEKMEVAFICGFPQRTSKISSLSNRHKESKTKLCVTLSPSPPPHTPPHPLH